MPKSGCQPCWLSPGHLHFLLGEIEIEDLVNGPRLRREVTDKASSASGNLLLSIL